MSAIKTPNPRVNDQPRRRRVSRRSSPRIMIAAILVLGSVIVPILLRESDDQRLETGVDPADSPKTAVMTRLSPQLTLTKDDLSESKTTAIAIDDISRTQKTRSYCFVDQDARPIDHEKVVVVDTQEMRLVRQRTDATGTIKLAADRGYLFVVQPSETPARLMSSINVGQDGLVVVPLGGAEIVGQLYVDGAPAGPGLTLDIRNDGRFASIRHEDLPEFAWRHIDARELESFVVTTDAEGRFRLRGLTAAWTGTATLPTQLLPSDPRFLKLDVARSRATIYAASALEVRGFCLDAATKSAVDGAIVTVGVSNGRDPETTLRAATDGDGRFAIAVGQDVVGDALDLSIEYRGLTHHASAVRTDDGRFDAGVVELPLGGAAQLTVLDAKGAPVEGAVAAISGDPEIFGPSDERGTLAISSVPRGRLFLDVCARGFAAKRIECDTLASSGATTVVLAPTSSVRLTVEDRLAQPVRNQLVSLSAQKSPFVGGSISGAAVAAYRMRPGPQSRTASHFETSFTTSEEGTVDIPCIETGVEMTFAVGPIGQPLDRPQSIVLAAGERREISFRIDGQIVPRFSGEVVDRNGRPVVFARVEWNDVATGQVVVGRTDDEGRFAFENILARDAAVRVMASGFERSETRTNGLSSIRVVLAAAVPLEITLVDEGGTPVDVSTCDLVVGGHREHAIRRAEGLYRTERGGIDGSAEIAVRVGPTRFVRTAEVVDGRCSVRLPRLGRVAIEGMDALMSDVGRAWIKPEHGEAFEIGFCRSDIVDGVLRIPLEAADYRIAVDRYGTSSDGRYLWSTAMNSTACRVERGATTTIRWK